MIDMEREPDVDKIAEVAFGLTELIRTEDLNDLHDRLGELCLRHPAKAAQIIMALVAWVNLEEETESLWQRVEAITDTRVERHLWAAA